jgi:hypothetical protein
MATTNAMSPNGTGFTYGYSTRLMASSLVHENKFTSQTPMAPANVALKPAVSSFAPTWSPMAQLPFVSGDITASPVHMSAAMAASSNLPTATATGFIAFLDVPDFHDGNGLPVWSNDGQRIFLRPKIKSTGNIELYRHGWHAHALTNTPAGTLHYHPTVARWRQLLIVSNTAASASLSS